ncbi:MAG: glycine oxidase ThiO [Methylococcales bacterium]
MNNDILIIGAGIIGLMTALECRRAGATVTLLDRSCVGQEASWAGGGILSPLYPWKERQSIDALRYWSSRYFPSLAAELLDATGIDVELNRCGMLIAEVDDQQLAQNRLSDQDIPFTWVDNNDLTASHPGLKLATNQSLWLPTIEQIRNPRLLVALKQLLITLDVTIVEQHQVTQFNLTECKSRINSVETQQHNFSAAQVVLTAGAWSQGLWPRISQESELHIFPVKGQMLLLQAPVASIPSMVLRDHQYIVPRKDGHVLVGSTVEYTDFDKVTTVPARRQLKAFFDSLYPIFSELPVIRHWAGIRPGSNGKPIIAKHPEIENLYINSGHFRNGLNLAPASARLIVDLMIGREPIVVAHHYSL